MVEAAAEPLPAPCGGRTSSGRSRPGVIDAARAEALWRFLQASRQAGADLRPRFDLVHVLWYAGALIVIGAMGLFTSLAFAQLGGGALALDRGGLRRAVHRSPASASGSAACASRAAC